MKILFYGSQGLLGRVGKQVVGQPWEIFVAKDLEEVLDFEGNHSFQGAIFDFCEGAHAVCMAAKKVKAALKIPVTIGLTTQHLVGGLLEGTFPYIDIVLPECGSDSLTKLQCDTIVRLANGAQSDTITCNGLSYHLSEDTFSVNGRTVHLTEKKHKLLELLFLKRGRVVTTEMVFDHLYGWNEPPSPKIVNVFICHIRQTLREAGLGQACIETVWGQGYRVSKTKRHETGDAA